MTKTARYLHENSYETLNQLQPHTKNIWVCFHGLGYLAKYFKKYFQHLDYQDNYIIVLQAPSKYYQDKSFKHVGASWLTREDTAQETENNLRYTEAVLKNENVLNDPRVVLFGYSQGVSMACRFLKTYQRPVKSLIMHSGSIPKELDSDDGRLMSINASRVIHISGKRDEYATPDRVKEENQKINMLFGTECELHRPDIKHEVDVELLNSIAKDLV